MPWSSKKVAIVTGGAQGIGLAIVRRLAEDGFSVLAIDRQAEAVTAAAEDLAGSGLNVRGAGADVTDRASIVEALRGHDSLAACVCAAAVGYMKCLDSVTEEDFRVTLDVNVTGSFIGSLLRLSLQSCIHPIQLRQRRAAATCNPVARCSFPKPTRDVSPGQVLARDPPLRARLKTFVVYLMRAGRWRWRLRPL